MSAEDRQSDLAVMGANEYKNKSRLESILTQRQNVFDARDQARDLLISGEIQPDGRNLIVLNATRQYLEEVWNLVLRHAQQQEGEGSYYLTGKRLGTIELRGRENKQIRGLSSYLFSQRRYVQEWTEEVRWRHGDDRTRTRRETKTVPVEISRRAFRTINRFLDNVHDLDIQFEELDDKVPQRTPQKLDLPDVVQMREVADLIEDELGVAVDTRAAHNGGAHGD